MTKTEQTLLALIKYMVNGTETFKLDDNINCEQLIRLSNLQGISILIIDGLQQYLSAHPECRPFDEENSADRLRRLQWFGQVVIHERMYAKHRKEIANLSRLYAKVAIKMMVLKGYGLSLDWPVPNHRSVGDMDVYHYGKWQEADALVEKECGIKIDRGHEHHTLFNFNGILVENHYDFINTKAHRDAPKIETRLKKLAEKGNMEIEMKMEDAKIYLPSADFNAIFLMRHMGQHFSGERLSLRQVLDWGFFMRAHHAEVDWLSTINFLKEIGLYKFFNRINAICVNHLGFSEESFPTIERRENIEQRILMDIFHPEFDKKKPEKGMFPILLFKFNRWWNNRWKHKMIYNDDLLMTFVTLTWSHLKRYKSITD